jgi:transcriptional regulator with XRE-family HTH domain
MDYPLYSEDAMSLFLKSFRMLRGLTQMQLAEKLNMDQRTISVIEKCPTASKMATIMKICKALDVEIVLREKSYVTQGPKI